MQPRLTLLTLCGWLLLAQAPAWAIVLESGKLRVAGIVDSEDGDQIVVRIKVPGGKDKVQAFERSKVKIIHEVDRKRLEKLTKENPKEYHDYASVLAKQTTDPEATGLAIRLFLIAAYLDTPNLGRSSFVKMSAVAPSPADAQKYRAMAFLLDIQSDPKLLKSEPGKVVAPTVPETKTPGLTEFLTALKLYRSGDLSLIKDAAKYTKTAGVTDLFSKAPGKLSQKDFAKACTDAVCTKCKKGFVNCTKCNGMGMVMDPMFGNFQKCNVCMGARMQKCNSCDGLGLNPYSEEYLKVLLRAEIWALDQILAKDVMPKKTAGDLSWSRTLNTPQSPPAALLRLETVTEYDPRACLYRDGKWVAP